MASSAGYSAAIFRDGVAEGGVGGGEGEWREGERGEENYEANGSEGAAIHGSRKEMRPRWRAWWTMREMRTVVPVRR